MNLIFSKVFLCFLHDVFLLWNQLFCLFVFTFPFQAVGLFSNVFWFLIVSFYLWWD